MTQHTTVTVQTGLITAVSATLDVTLLVFLKVSQRSSQGVHLNLSVSRVRRCEYLVS